MTTISKTKKILLIEDDEDTRATLSRMLTKGGYAVQTLVDGRQLLEPGFPLPDVFILDHHIPTIDGVALTKFLKIQARTRGIPVVMISGATHVCEKARRAGVRLFLNKPVQGKTLLEQLQDVFEKNDVSKDQAIDNTGR
jgi:FixJ family two-component response regulator